MEEKRFDIRCCRVFLGPFCHPPCGIFWEGILRDWILWMVSSETSSKSDSIDLQVAPPFVAFCSFVDMVDGHGVCADEVFKWMINRGH
jgi:hypothetical protein